MWRWIRRLALVVVTVVIAALIGLGLDHRRTTELPAPTGSFAIGRTSYTWDGIRAWVWYPASVAAPATDYLPPAIRTEWEHARPRFINFLTRDLAKVSGHSTQDVAVSDAQPRYPVAILRGGGGGGSALSFSSLAEDLASHGYIVVGLELTTTANPEGCVGRPDEEECAAKIMAPLVDGIGRAINHLEQLNQGDSRFAGKLDLSRVGVFGHSFGGAQAAEFCAQDSRCKAGINIDGRLFGNVIRTGIAVPFMFLLSDHSAENDAVSQHLLGQIQSVYERQLPATRLRVAIRGAHHFTFSDDGALLKSELFRGVLRLFGKLSINGRRQVEVTAYLVRTFFDTHLKDAPDTADQPTVATFPEIVILK